MPTVPKKKEPTKQKELPLTPRLDKIIANRVEQGMIYEYDSQDKRELVFNELKRRYPDSVKLSYQWVIRVKQQPSGLEYLVYHCNESVTDRDNNDHYYDSLLGVWPAIESQGKIDPESGQRVNASIKRSYNVFDIPYSPDKAEEILYDKRLILQPSQFLIGIANDEPGEVVRGRKWVVPNAEEFVKEEFDTLLWGAENGYLEREKGGAQRAKNDLAAELKDQQQEQQQEPHSSNKKK